MLWIMRRHGPWLSSAVIGLILVAAGLFFLVKGLDARAQIKRELTDEQITTSADAVKFGVPAGVPVTDAVTAKAQADVIKSHTLGTWGPYSQLPRDDPRRVTFVDGVSLRTALGMAVMGFGLADMAIGSGIIILVAGVATAGLAAPALFFLAGMVVPPRAKKEATATVMRESRPASR